MTTPTTKAELLILVEKLRKEKKNEQSRVSKIKKELKEKNDHCKYLAKDREKLIMENRGLKKENGILKNDLEYADKRIGEELETDKSIRKLLKKAQFYQDFFIVTTIITSLFLFIVCIA